MLSEKKDNEEYAQEKPKKDTDKTRAVLDLALRRFKDINAAVVPVRQECFKDRRFCSVPGAQWEGKLADDSKARVRLEANFLHREVMRVVGDVDNSQISVRFIAKIGQGQDATSADQVADFCAGIFRADEHESHGKEAYLNATEEAAKGGMGAWRWRAVYEDEEDPDNDCQRAAIEPIHDADLRVFFDPNAHLQDKSDAKYCFVLTPITKEAYEEEWGDEPQDWPVEIKDLWGSFNWYSPTLKMVHVAEYYVKEKVEETLVYFEEIDGKEIRLTLTELEANPEWLEEFTAFGTKEVKRRKLKVTKVRKYILSGGGVLEDCGHIAGKYIPIVPLYGQRFLVDGVEHCMGKVRLAKDLQTLSNVMMSWLADIASHSSTSKPIFTPEQTKGHENTWANAQLKNYAYLTINPVTVGETLQPMGPVGQTSVPEIPPAVAALLQITNVSLKEILGNPQEGDKMISNIGERTMKAVQNRIDAQNYIYMRNLTAAMKYSGQVWLSMAKDLYVERGRYMSSMGPDNAFSRIQIMEPSVDKHGAQTTKNDLGAANFEVFVDVGPSSVSSRAAAFDALLSVIPMVQDPQAVQMLNYAAVLNMEGEGLVDIRAFFRKHLVMAGVLPPNENEKEEVAKAKQQENPQTTYLKAAAEEANANATNARAGVVGTMAKAGLNQAQTLKIMAELPPQLPQQAPPLPPLNPAQNPYIGQEAAVPPQQEAAGPALGLPDTLQAPLVS